MIKELEDTKKGFLKFFGEFGGFILKKNAVDMALGIVIGLSFSKVITSLVNDVIMPPIGILLTGVSFKELKLVLKKAILNSKGIIIEPEIAINYGRFLQTLVDFAVVSLSIFIVVKVMNRMLARKESSIDWTQFIKK